MRNLLLFTISCLLVSNLFGTSIDTIKTNSKITDVTVFFSGAQIIRQADVKLAKGKYMLTVNELPNEINPQSIQVQQMDNCKILSVKHRIEPRNESIDKTKKSNIEKQVKDKEQEIKNLRNQINVFDIEERLLLDNSNFQRKEQGTTISEIKEAADFYRTRLNEIRKQKMTLYSKIETIEEEIKGFYLKLNELVNKVQNNSGQIFIAVDCEKDITAKLKVSYFTPLANWTPLYDFRVDDTEKPLQIIYNANVIQTSGEKWDNIKIKLSTSNPTLSGEKPDLTTWYIDRYKRIENKTNDLVKGSLKGVITDASTGDPLPYINVVLLKNGIQVDRTTTDMDGIYTIRSLSPGEYDIQMTYLGYKSVKLTGITLVSGNLSMGNIQMKQTSVKMNDVEVMTYKAPKLNKGTNDIARMPVNNVDDIISTVAGVSYGSPARGESNMIDYVDGVRSYSGSSNIPRSAIAETQVKLGGTPASSSGEFAFKGDSYESLPDYYRSSSKSKSPSIETNYISSSLKSTATGMEYTIDIPYTIPSDGSEYSIKMKEVSVPVSYIYHAVPKIEEKAFLSAEIIDWQELNLLSGKSSIYYQGTFVGESYVDANLSSDTLAVSLGRDQNIVVTRNEDKKINDKRIMGNNIKETIGYDISIKNNKKVPIRIIIEDQFPVSEKKSIEVERIEYSNAQLDDKTGKLTWDLSIQPNEKQNVSYKFSVKYPKTSVLYY